MNVKKKNNMWNCEYLRWSDSVRGLGVWGEELVKGGEMWGPIMSMGMNKEDKKVNAPRIL